VALVAAPAPLAAPIEPVVAYSAPAFPEAAPVYRPVAGKTVIIDAGHGGDDHGASHYGLREKDINLDLANRTAKALQAQGVAVLMTRRNDSFVSLPERSAFANRSPNAVFVSIHVNASDGNPNASGIETFLLTSTQSDAERSVKALARYRASDPDPVRGKQALANLTAHCRTRGPVLAESVQKNLVARMGAVDRGVKTGNLAVLRETYFCPAILVEVGFLTNHPTALSMRTDEWRRRTAEALAEGIVDYLRQPE
jgi:N-acetylmuramoyl-L-alanine amidase